MLEHFRALSRNEELIFLALWGKLAAEILLVQWEDAVKDLHALRDQIDSRVRSAAAALGVRCSAVLTWLAARRCPCLSWSSCSSALGSFTGERARAPHRLSQTSYQVSVRLLQPARGPRHAQ
jgi:hypothetical protein